MTEEEKKKRQTFRKDKQICFQYINLVPPSWFKRAIKWRFSNYFRLEKKSMHKNTVRNCIKVTTTFFANTEVICNKTLSTQQLFLYCNKIFQYLEIVVENVSNSALRTCWNCSWGRNKNENELWRMLTTLSFYLKYQANTYNSLREVNK